MDRGEAVLFLLIHQEAHAILADRADTFKEVMHATRVWERMEAYLIAEEANGV